MNFEQCLFGEKPELYMFINPQRKIEQISNGNSKEDFNRFIRGIVSKFTAEQSIPRSWLVRYEISPQAWQKLNAMFVPSDRVKRLEEAIQMARINATHVIPLPKAVFCQLRNLDYCSNLNNQVLYREYSDFFMAKVCMPRDVQPTMKHTRLEPVLRQDSILKNRGIKIK